MVHMYITYTYGTIGHYFFENNEGNAVMVTAEWYHQMYKYFLRPVIADNSEMCSTIRSHITQCSGHNSIPV